MIQPVCVKKARVSLPCSSEECWELFALPDSSVLLFLEAQTPLFCLSKYAFVFYVARCKEAQWPWYYGRGLFVLMVFGKPLMEVEMDYVCLHV